MTKPRNEFFFPQAEKAGDVAVAYGGATMRDWFAGMALMGMSAQTGMKGKPKDFAKAAYQLADAMLEERDW